MPLPALLRACASGARLTTRDGDRVRPVRWRGVLRAFSQPVSIPFLPGERESTSRARRSCAACNASCALSRWTCICFNFSLAWMHSLSAFSFSPSAFCFSARDLNSSARRLSMRLKASSSNSYGIQYRCCRREGSFCGRWYRLQTLQIRLPCHCQDRTVPCNSRCHSMLNCIKGSPEVSSSPRTKIIELYLKVIDSIPKPLQRIWVHS